VRPNHDRSLLGSTVGAASGAAGQQARPVVARQSLERQGLWITAAVIVGAVGAMSASAIADSQHHAPERKYTATEAACKLLGESADDTYVIVKDLYFNGHQFTVSDPDLAARQAVSQAMEEGCVTGSTP
jgi:hypothetical protein